MSENKDNAVDKSVCDTPPKIAKIEEAPNATKEGIHALGLPVEYSGWDVYNNEAKKVDTELVKDWTASLNFLLVFAAIFAAVLTAFIIDSKKLLQEDPTSVMAEVMIFYTNSLANGTHHPYTQPNFEAPFSAVVVNCLFFASLSASLIAALASVIALQWVADYDSAITRGGSSPEDRAKRRQFRYGGVVQWKMNEIIAALPLLLYASVILFFAGLIVWMYVVHPTVGFVVAGGTAVAIIFYTTTTLLAAVYVSAPFKTPLSRGIYALSRLPFVLACTIARLLRVAEVPPWLERQRALYTVSHKREDRAVETRGELARDALVWLASQLSVSQDSYRRLLLLVGELPNLDPKHLPYFNSTESAWYSIFDLLGRANLKNPREGTVSGEDAHAMTVLMRCHSIPGIQQLVAPNHRTLYLRDKRHVAYWKQYCDIPQTSIQHTDSSFPNSLYLALRDLPNTENPSVKEAESTVALSRWRNTDPNSPHVWKSFFHAAHEFSSSFFNASVEMFSEFVIRRAYNIRYSQGSAERRGWDAVDELLVKIIRDIVKVAVNRLDVDANATVVLLHAYEAIISLAIDLDRIWPLIRSPQAYIWNLGLRPAEDHVIHESFILLLSRQIRSYPLTQRPQRVWEVVLMLWLRPSNQASKGRLENPDEPLHPSNVIDWLNNADSIPHIIGIIRNLAAAQTEEPEVGSLWRATGPGEGSDPQFVDILQLFNRLMGPECTPEDHLTMVNALCQDLELEQPPEFEGYFTPRKLRSIAWVHDKCLQVLARHAQGFAVQNLDNLDEEYSRQWGGSVERLKQHIQRVKLRARPPVTVRRMKISLCGTDVASSFLKAPSDTRVSLLS
ncbi:hypothetical protein M408DRAFT_213117 [Serendipita vermifera MAFF 305830]|uniref:DUF6535 domain-containing protein n=1 Tax=Serendipita vermifera MAFF 305830 TaxID=933852 RepID=A0A0C2XT54_SERVB|nr:hypothetical protein M408DRAFT_213117 [Serendipita vermifera MAFF 305830]